jgi:hypothetical protein
MNFGKNYESGMKGSQALPVLPQGHVTRSESEIIVDKKPIHNS